MFQVLGIEPTADTRAIRRAYAAALKRIDQQTQREAFEQLREAYEWALRWAESRPSAAAPADAATPASAAAVATPVSAPSVPIPAVPKTPGEIRLFAGDAGLAMDRDDTGRDEERASPPIDFSPRQPPQDLVPRQAAKEESRNALRRRARAVDHWVAELMRCPSEDVAAQWRRAMADPELQHLEATAAFSDALLRALAANPEGKMALYGVAMARFDWANICAADNDTPARQWLNRVLNEGGLLQREKPHVRDLHERAIAEMLRRPAPTRRQARQYEDEARALCVRMPNWTTLQVPRSTQRNWLDMVGEAPKKPRVAWSVRRTLGWGWWALVLCNVIYHLATQNAHKEEGASRAPPSAYQASTPPPLTAEQSRQSFKQSFLPDRLSHAASGDSSSLPYDHRSLLPYDKQAQLPTTMLDPANPPPTAEHSGLQITLDVPGAAGKPPGKLHLTVPPPAYPASARRKGEQGEVRVRVLINHEKKIIVTLAASSGHPDLDDAALRAARGMQLTGDAPPATGLTAVLPFAFALKP